MSQIKDAVYIFIGVLGSVCLVLLTIILRCYGCVLRAIFHPDKVADYIISICGDFQNWIDKHIN